MKKNNDRTSRHKTCAILLCLLFSPMLSSLALTVEMDVQPRVLRIGEPAELKITVRGIDQPSPPAIQPINGLQINGPNIGTTFNSSFVNGRMTTDRATIFTYQIVPMQEGNFQIGPYEYREGNRSIPLGAIQIKAVGAQAAYVPGNVENPNQRPALLARMTATRQELYTQEVFDLYIEILHLGDINVGRDINLMNMPSAGLRLTPFQELNTVREVYNNEVYHVRRFRCKAYALNAGTHTINPTLRIPLILPRQRRGRSFFDDPFADMFGGGRTEQVSITPEPLTLTVNPLPPPAPRTRFSGGVGDFAFSVEARPTELEVGEPITVRMSISGTGNIEQAMPPEFPADERFRVYEMRRTESDISQDTAQGRRVFEQVVIPRDENIRELPAIDFVYFDPQAARYVTIKQGPFPLSLKPSTRQAAQLLQGRAPGTGEEPEMLAADLVHLKPPPNHWRVRKSRELLRSPVFWCLQAFPLLALTACWLIVRRRRDLRNDRAKARRLRAPRRARAGLERARKALRAGDWNDYYEGIWDALCSYFGDRLDLAPGEVEPATVLAACRQGGLDAELADALARIFEQCEHRRYAGTPDASPEPSSCESDLRQIPTLLKAAERIRL